MLTIRPVSSIEKFMLHHFCLIFFGEIQMATTFFIFSVIGLLFVQRISQKNIFSRMHSRFHQIFFVIFVVLLAIFFRKIDLIFYVVGLFLLSTIIFDLILVQKQKKAALLRGISFLDEVILLVRSGRSLKFSVETSLNSVAKTSQGADFEFWYRDHFLQLREVREKNLLHPQNLFFEMGKISRSKSAALEQLILLRRHFKLLENLRHKSGQAALQAELQAGILFFIYTVLVTSMILFFGFSRVEPFFVTSLLPQLAGIFFVQRIPKWFKWKI